MSKMSETIKHKIMVLSGKGGVGKTTVATGIALSLAKMGKKVGLMDIDITGPNVPKMLGLEGTELHRGWSDFPSNWTPWNKGHLNGIPN